MSSNDDPQPAASVISVQDSYIRRNLTKKIGSETNVKSRIEDEYLENVTVLGRFKASFSLRKQKLGTTEL